MNEHEYDKKLYEFSRTEPEIAVGLIEELHRKREEHYNLLLKLNRNARKIYEKIKDKQDIIKIVKFSEKEYIDKPLAGIDGSMYVIGGRGKRYYAFISAVIVLMERGLSSTGDSVKTLYPRDCIRVEAFDDPSLGNEVQRIAEDMMFYYETKALYEVNHMCREQGKCYYVFIDGPIIDPPRELTSYGKKFTYERLKNDIIGRHILSRINSVDSIYYSYRIHPFIEAWNLRSREHYIVGYVKSTRTEQLLTKELVNNGVSRDLVWSFTGDDEIAYMVLSNAVGDTDNYAYLGPFRITCYDDELRYMRPYLDEGLTLYYIYGINRWRNKVFRLELGVSEDTQDNIDVSRVFDNLYKLVLTITLPGNVHPLPVVVAHEKCKIRPGAAQLIYELLLSGIYSDVISSNELNESDTMTTLNLLREVIEKH